MLGVRHEVTNEGQAAIELEHLAAGAAGAPADRRTLAYRFGDDGRIHVGDLLAGIVTGLDHGVDSVVGGSIPRCNHGADRHRCRAGAIEHGLDVVGLTGGVFQNALLVETTRRALTSKGFRVLTHRIVPPNDGGLALGQVVIAGRSSFCH